MDGHGFNDKGWDDVWCFEVWQDMMQGIEFGVNIKYCLEPCNFAF